MADPTVPTRDRGPARAAAVLAVVILFGALGLLGSYLLHSERAVAGTPAPHALFHATAFTVPPHQRACMSSITLPPDGRLLQFELREGSGSSHESPPIDALLGAPGYRALAHLPAGQPEGEVELPVHPPRRFVIGSACLINRGTTGAIFAGSTEARSRSRSTLTINGKPVAGDIALTFLNNHRQSRLGRLGEVIEHASNLTDRLVPAWLIWILGVMAICVAPIATVAMFHRALREDELAASPSTGSAAAARGNAGDAAS